MHHELLVIDDAALHLAVLCKIAEQVGFRATGAHSVAEASQLLHDRAFDCITLDLSLGEESGIEVLQELSKIKCPTPIIVISASGQQACDETVRIGNVLNLNICSPIPRPIHLSAVRTALTRIAACTEKQGFVSVAG
jgi:DNA-binding response OmpR family regulator